MARKVNLRNNCDSEVSSISHDILDFLLCIESAITGVVKFVPVLADHGTVSPGTDFSKLRIFLDFDSPSLVLSKMPVETVQLICCHHVQESLHLIDIEKMTGNVKMHSSVCESRLVLDGSARENPLCRRLALSVECSRKHLADGLCSISETGSGRSLNLHAPFGNVKPILLRSKFFIQFQFNAFSSRL